MSGEPWYRNGLRFQCTGCGHCCRGAPGTVRVSDAEIAALARRLELSDADFRAMHTRPLRGGDVSLRERQNGDCVFWSEARGCTVHSDRPLQCRSFPFWRSIVHSPERWSQEAESCPGMNQGPLWSVDWIQRVIGNDGTPRRPILLLARPSALRASAQRSQRQRSMGREVGHRADFRSFSSAGERRKRTSQLPGEPD